MMLRRFLTVALLLLAYSAGVAASDYPTRPIKLVMGFGPGGLGDIAGRLIGQKMTESMGQPIVIDYRPGAGGIVAATTVTGSPADGYTVLWVSGQNAISANLFKNPRYDWDRELTPVGAFGTFAYVMYVHSSSPYKTFTDIVEAARTNPDKFNFGSVSVGTAQNLSALKFVADAKLKNPVVTFRTTGEVITALASGTVQVAFENLPGVIGQIKAGALRPIAVSSVKRISALPSTPTIAESGLPQYATASWIGWAVPAQTPKFIVQKLNEELNKAVASPQVSARLKELLIDPQVGPPEALQNLYQDEVRLWKKVINEAGIPQQ